MASIVRRRICAVAMFLVAAGAIAGCGGAEVAAPTAGSEPEPVTEQQSEQAGVVVGMVGSPTFSTAEGQYIVEEVRVQLDDGQTVTARVDLPDRRSLGVDEVGPLPVLVEQRGSGWFVIEIRDDD